MNICCFCGAATDSGILIRMDPKDASLKCTTHVGYVGDDHEHYFFFEVPTDFN